MAKEKDQDTEKRIKEAATKIFTEKGLAGARMQEIADAAGVNKALVHYYFRNKKNLFELIFEEKLFKLFGALSLIIFSGETFEEKIRQFVSTEIDTMMEFPQMPMFVLSELQQNPNMMKEKMKDKPIGMVRQQLRTIFQKEIDAGRIRDIPIEQFMINLISLCIFPFMGKPMISFVLDLDEEAFQKIVTDRKKLVADLILNDILIK